MKTYAALVFTVLLGTSYAQSRKPITIPFTFEDDFITLQVHIHDTPLLFVFDTGATSTVLDSATAVQIRQAPTSRMAAQGASGSASYQRSTLKTIRVNNLELKNITAVHVPLTRLSSSFGKTIHGIIGNDILLRYTVEIDYDSGVLRLYGAQALPPLHPYQKIPFTFVHNIPIPAIALEVELQNGARLTGTYLVDSGAGATLIFNTPFAKDNNLYTHIGKTIPSSSKDLTSKSITHRGLIKQVALGNHAFSDVPVSLSETESGVNALPGMAGIVGNEILKRFNWLLDYNRKTLYLKPNHHYAAAFAYPKCGFTYERVGDKILVTEVTEASDAHKKGLRVGFEIEQFGDYSGSDFEKIRALLQADGTLLLKVRDLHGTSRTLEIVLQRLL